MCIRDRGNADRTEPLTLVGPKGLERVVNALRVIAPELPFEIKFIEITPVSYTHLDVYKRQAQVGEMLGGTLAMFACVTDPEAIVIGDVYKRQAVAASYARFTGCFSGIFQIGKVSNLAYPALTPVSYTHLDVYKRQDLILLQTNLSRPASYLPWVFRQSWLFFPFSALFPVWES